MPNAKQKSQKSMTVKKPTAKKSARQSTASKQPRTKATSKRSASERPAVSKSASSKSSAKKAASKTAAKKAASTTATSKAAAKKTARSKAAAKKTATSKAAAKKTAPSKAARSKAAAKQTARSKAAAKKTAASKAAAKKTAAKQTAPKQTAPKKAAAKQSAAKKTASRKAAPKKTASRKTAPKKTASRKAAPKKTASRKAAPKKTASKKAAPKKTAPKTAAAKKTARSKTAAKKAAPKKPAPRTAASSKTARKPAARPPTPSLRERWAALAPGSDAVMAARRFYALPVDDEAHAAADEGLTDQAGDDLVAAHLGRNFGYFGAIDKTLSGFYVLDDEGDNYYLADLRDSGQVYWQDHETRDVSPSFDSVADYAAYRAAREEARDDDDFDDDEVAARFRPRRLASRAAARPTTAALLARYQWLVWFFARAHELRGEALEHDDDMVRRAFGHLRRAFPTRAAEEAAFAAERARLADDPQLAVYWLLHTSVFADLARRDEVVQALADSEHPLVRAFVAAFGHLAETDDVAAAPGFRARRSLLLFFGGGAVAGESVDLDRLVAALLADPVTHGFAKALRLVDAAAEADALARLEDLALLHLGPEPGLQALAALLDARAGRTSAAADSVLEDMSESADVDLIAAALEALHGVSSARARVAALVDAVLARDPYHWGVLHVGRDAATRDGDDARAAGLAARIAALAEVRPVMLQLFADDDDERERGLKRFARLEPARRLLLARRLVVMAGQIEGDVLAAAVDVLLAGGDADALAALHAAALALPDVSDLAQQLGERREDGIVDLADPLLPLVQALLARPESGEFMADDYKGDLVEKLAPIAHEEAVFDWLLTMAAADERHQLRDDILSKLFIAYDDNQVVARLSEGQADRLVRLAARLGVKPEGAGDDDEDDEDAFPAIHVYHAAGRVLFYFTHPGGVPAIAELLPGATDVELLGNLYSALRHIKTADALRLLRSRLFDEQRQIWNLCNAIAETFDDAAHAEILAALADRPSDHAANSYACVLLDFAGDTKKKPHAHVAAIARAVLGWPAPGDPRARGQRGFVLLHAVRLGLESGDHELVREAHAAAQALAEPPFSNLSGLHYERPTEDPLKPLKARERKQLDAIVAASGPAQPRRAAAPILDISDDALAELAGVPIDRRFLTAPGGEVWFFDRQGRLLVFDGLEVAAPKFAVAAELDDLGAFLAGAERCDGHVVHWDAEADQFRDIARYGDRVLVFEGTNNGNFTSLGLVAGSPDEAAALYAKLAEHPQEGWSVAGAWYVPQRGGVQRTYYAPLPDGGYNDARERLHELRDDPDALADVEARALALLKRPGARVACIEWMERLRRPVDMGLLEHFRDRARDDQQPPRWHLEAFAEYERLLAAWGWTDALPDLSVSRGGPVDDAALARFAVAAGADVPASLRDAWREHGPLAWRLGGRGRAFLAPDDALARGPALAARIDAVAAGLPPPRAEAFRAAMVGAQVVIEDEQQAPVVLFTPASPARAGGRVFVAYDVAGPPDDLWYEGAFAWFLAGELGAPFVDALAEACPDLLGLPHGARRHPGVVRRRLERDGQFWEVVFDPEAAFVLTRHGRLGAAGSEKLRRFAAADEARASFEALLAARTGEGYQPVA